MALELSKGQNISLTKTVPNLKKMIVGLGWDPRDTTGAAFDLDASAAMLDGNGKVRTKEDLIYYNNLESKCGSIVHTGDNLTGEGEGDDEQIIINLPLVPADIDKIAFPVTIHEAAKRKQNFGQVKTAFIRIVNEETKEEKFRYDLTEDYSVETAVMFGELYRHNDEWKFRAVGQGYTDDDPLRAMIARFGI